MQTSRIAARLLCALLFAAGAAHAAKLAPYQQAALQKVLATIPAAQRDMLRPQLEQTLSGMSKQQVDMMLASMGGNAPAAAAAPATAAAPAPAPSGGGEWGKAEADFERAFTAAQGFNDRVSDLRDQAKTRWDKIARDLQDEWSRKRDSSSLLDNTAFDTCNRELNGIPIGRRQSPAVTEALREQDRILLRIMVEHRATYKSVDQFAAAVMQPVSSPMVQAVRHYFSPPLPEGEVKTRLLAIERDLGALHESTLREYHRIAMTGYPDQGSGVSSKLQARDFEALRARTAKAAQAICAPGMEAYHRGLVTFMDPVVAKARPYISR